MTKQVVVGPATLVLAVGLVIALLVIAVMATVMFADGDDGKVPSTSDLPLTTPISAATDPSPSSTPARAVATETVPPPTPPPLPTETPIVIIVQATAQPAATAAPATATTAADRPTYQASTVVGQAGQLRTSGGRTLDQCLSTGGPSWAQSARATYEGGGLWIVHHDGFYSGLDYAEVSFNERTGSLLLVREPNGCRYY